MTNKEQLIEEARSRYLGRDGHEKANCAQAVAETFVREFHLDGVDLSAFRRLGGGQAPGGECGALYAAKCVLEKAGCADEAEKLDALFSQKGGATACRQIRAGRRLPCAGCVETAAAYLCDCMKD